MKPCASYLSAAGISALRWRSNSREDLHEGADRPAHDALSAREFEILVMIGSGKTVTQIAEELHLSAATVSTYRTRVLEKMNMATTAELMRYAFRNHLVD